MVKPVLAALAVHLLSVKDKAPYPVVVCLPVWGVLPHFHGLLVGHETLSYDFGIQFDMARDAAGFQRAELEAPADVLFGKQGEEVSRVHVAVWATFHVIVNAVFLGMFGNYSSQPLLYFCRHVVPLA